MFLGEHSKLLCESLLTPPPLPQPPPQFPGAWGLHTLLVGGRGGTFMGQGRQLAMGACGGCLCQCPRGFHMANGQSSTHTPWVLLLSHSHVCPLKIVTVESDAFANIFHLQKHTWRGLWLILKYRFLRIFGSDL